MVDGVRRGNGVVVELKVLLKVLLEVSKPSF
jgi:hypothetical protein